MLTFIRTLVCPSQRMLDSLLKAYSRPVKLIHNRSCYTAQPKCLQHQQITSRYLGKLRGQEISTSGGIHFLRSMNHPQTKAMEAFRLGSECDAKHSISM